MPLAVRASNSLGRLAALSRAWLAFESGSSVSWTNSPSIRGKAESRGEVLRTAYSSRAAVCSLVKFDSLVGRELVSLVRHGCGVWSWLAVTGQPLQKGSTQVNNGQTSSGTLRTPFSRSVQRRVYVHSSHTSPPRLGPRSNALAFPFHTWLKYACLTLTALPHYTNFALRHT